MVQPIVTNQDSAIQGKSEIKVVIGLEGNHKSVALVDENDGKMQSSFNNNLQYFQSSSTSELSKIIMIKRQGSQNP